jgi:hypothetical protein
MEHELATALGANKPDSGEQPAPADINAVIDQVYGTELRVSVKRPANRPELLMIEWSFCIDCGNDSMLLVYEHQSSRWKQVLRWQSKDVGSISDAFGDFLQYAVVPLGAPGNWVWLLRMGIRGAPHAGVGFDLDVIRQPRWSHRSESYTISRKDMCGLKTKVR